MLDNSAVLDNSVVLLDNGLPVLDNNAALDNMELSYFCDVQGRLCPRFTQIPSMGANVGAWPVDSGYPSRR
jgi:hypothetical protein